jgi:hypothetical protein
MAALASAAGGTVPTMTLVLGACTTDAVILGAESRTGVLVINRAGTVVSTGTQIDRKLFKLARVGIATYGAGPADVRVPDVLSAELHSEWGVAEVVSFLQQRFATAGDSMGALVGGLGELGEPVLFDVHMDGSQPTPIVPQPQLALRGIENGERELPPPHTAASVIAQMLERLTACADRPDVGPPYEFLLIPSPK